MRTMFDRPSRHPRGINMVPLINIVFLLLVFFMVTSTVRVIDPVDQALPEAGTGSGEEAPEQVLVLHADGRIELAGEAVPPGGLDAALAALAGEGVEEILVKADGSARASHLRTVMESARAAGIQGVALATRPEAP